MPNTKSAAKAMRQSKKRKIQNILKKEAFKKAIKEVRKFVSAAKKTEALEALKTAMKTLDKAVKTNVINKNHSSRLKSRLAKAIAKIK